MGISKSLLFLPFLILLSFSLLSPSSGADLYSLVYNDCANQNLSSGGGGGGAVSLSTIAALTTSLSAQAALAKFYKTNASASSGQSLFGLFQCRGDLSPGDCASCVSRVFPMWASLCGPAVAARVHLTGCYALYQVAGFPQVAGTQMLFTTCGSRSGGGAFEANRDTAFAQLQNGIAGGNGFYAKIYGGLYAVAQCEGDLSIGDCGDCVQEAVQRSKVECGSLSSGQVYLDNCYISYSYYRGGLPCGGGGGRGLNAWTIVAIVLGGGGGLGFLVMCLLFVKKSLKKKDDH